MLEVRKTSEFDAWLRKLKDQRAIAKIVSRIERVALGNPGDVKPIGGGLSEMRIDYGPGYRVYFIKMAKTILVLLCGGDKATQAKDIARAKNLAASLERD